MAVALRLEHRAAFHLQDNPDFGTLQQIPGTGPILVLTIPVWAVITPYLAESFRTEIRSCGYGISYSAATILPGLYSFYMLALAKVMPYEFTPIVLLILGGLMLSLGVLAGPETKNIDFS